MVKSMGGYYKNKQLEAKALSLMQMPGSGAKHKRGSPFANPHKNGHDKNYSDSLNDQIKNDYFYKQFCNKEGKKTNYAGCGAVAHHWA